MIVGGGLGKWQHSEITSQKNAISSLLLWNHEGSVQSVLAEPQLEGALLPGAAQLALLVPCKSS